MDALYWVFNLSVVIATFYVIVRRLSRQSYVIMATITVLYATLFLFIYLSN